MSGNSSGSSTNSHAMHRQTAITGRGVIARSCALALGLAVAGCAASGDKAEPIALAAPGGVGPVALPSPDEPARAHVVDRAVESPALSSPVQEPADSPAPAHATPAPRTDGRPSWWFDGVQRESGVVLVTAEALAPDLRAARRAAIDAGLARLGRELGSEPADWRVRAATVRPLRAILAPGEVNKFVGYVLIAATP